MFSSVAGGALGGATIELLSFVGFFLFGAVLGAAQALVLPRYLTNPTTVLILPQRLRDPRGAIWGTAVFWVLVSFAGWFAGLIVLVLVNLLTSGTPEVIRQIGYVLASLIGTDTASTFVPLFSLAWTLLAAFQALALVSVASGAARRLLLPLAVLWALVGAVGGALGVAGGLAIDARVFPDGDGSLFLGRILSAAATQAAAGTLYGAATGVVLVMIARRSASS